MKKIFLPLLAAVGMALGLTLSSCGGGGGSEKGSEPARALAGTSIKVVSGTPSFGIDFETANTGWTVTSEFTAGSRKSFPCFFNLTRDPKLENGSWEFWGSVGWADIEVYKDNNFLALIGVNQGAESCVLDKFILVLSIPDGRQQGVYAGSGQMMVSGRYFMSDGEAGGTKLKEDPREITFEMTGQLKTQYLAPFKGEEDSTVDFPYSRYFGLVIIKKRSANALRFFYDFRFAQFSGLMC